MPHRLLLAWVFVFGFSAQAGKGDLILVPQPPDPSQATALTRYKNRMVRCATDLISFSRRLANRIPFMEWVVGSGWDPSPVYFSTPDGSRLVTHELDYDYSTNSGPLTQHAKVVVLDGRTGNPLSERIFPRTQDSHPQRNIALSPDGKWVYVGFAGNGELELWDANTFTIKRSFPLPFRYVRFVIPSPSGRHLLVAVDSEPVGRGILKTAVLDLEERSVSSVIDTPVGLKTPIYFHPVEDLLVYVWEDGQFEVVRFDGSSVFSRGIRPHSLASVSTEFGLASILENGSPGRSIRFVEQVAYPSGQPLRQLQIKSPIDYTYIKPALSPNGLYLAYQTVWGTRRDPNDPPDQKIVLLNLVTGEEDIVRLGKSLCGFSFTPSGEGLVVLFGDQTHYIPTTLRMGDYFKGAKRLEFPDIRHLASPSAISASILTRVQIDLSRPPSVEGAVLEPYRNTRELWGPLMGKQVNVEFRYPDRTISVPQRLTSLERLRQIDRAFATSVETVLAAEKNLPPRRAGMHPDYALFLRGEALVFSIVAQDKAWDSLPISSNPEERPTLEGNQQLRGVTIEFLPLRSAFQKLKSKIHSPVTLRLVHTHAGTSAPNDPQDVEAARRLLEDFRKHFPGFQFKAQIAAVPAEEAGGQVFISEVK